MDRESNLAAFLAGNHPDVPRVMYHGTKYGNIDKFKGYRGTAGHFAFTPKEASDYAKGHDEVPHDDEYFHEEGPQVYPVHISAKNVFDARNPDHVKKIGVNPRGNWDYEDLEHSVSAMKKAGFDSYFDFEYGISQMQNDGSRKINEPTGIAVFHPHQIKSAIGNQGTFDPNDPDITKGDGGEVDGITAYHGSPHEFEQFDTSKIGTGEGAQAYGHGLYFAESEPVAESYREGLSNINRATGYADTHLNAKKLVERFNGDEGYAADVLTDRLSSLQPDTYEHNQIKETLNHILSGSYKKDLPRKGHMYEVHIDAHPDHFLDWDKPLSDQSPHIMKSLIEHRKENPTMWKKIKPHLDSDETAGTIYQHLAAGHPHGYAGASEWLQRAGIHGIRYLDAGSRGDTDQPTHNYVVFDHDRVNIKRRYEEGGRVGFGFGGDTEFAGSRPERGATGSAVAAREAPQPSYRDMPEHLQEAQHDLSFKNERVINAMKEANAADKQQKAEQMTAWAGAGFPAGGPNLMALGEETRPTAYAMSDISKKSPVMQSQADIIASLAPPPQHYESSVAGNQIAAAPMPQHYEPTFAQNRIDPAPQQVAFKQPARPISPTPVNKPIQLASLDSSTFKQASPMPDFQPQTQGGGSRRRLVKKLMPDGTYQDVWEEYAHGGVAKYHSNHHNPAIVEYALNKISAPPPALDPTLMVAKRGRPL